MIRGFVAEEVGETPDYMMLAKKVNSIEAELEEELGSVATALRWGWPVSTDKLLDVQQRFQEALIRLGQYAYSKRDRELIPNVQRKC